MDEKGYFLGTKLLSSGMECKVYLQKPELQRSIKNADFDTWNFGSLIFYNMHGRPTIQWVTDWQKEFIRKGIVKPLVRADKIRDYFNDTDLLDTQLERLCDCLETYYTLQSAIDIYCEGKLNRDTLFVAESKDIVKHINKDIENNILTNVDLIFKESKEYWLSHPFEKDTKLEELTWNYF